MIATLVALLLTMQAATTGTTSNTVSPVVVTAGASEHDVSSLVHAFSRTPVGSDQLVRWQVALCPVIVGPPKEQVSYLVERLQQNAQTYGISVGDKHCEPNLIIILAPDLSALTSKIASRYSRVLGPNTTLNQFSAERIDFYKHDAKPYHKFIMTTEVLASHGANGHVARRIDEMLDTSSTIDFSGLKFFDPTSAPTVSYAHESYILPNTDRSFSRMVLAVDEDRLKTLTLQQVSAYLTMIGLANVNDDPDAGLRTILQAVDPKILRDQKPVDLTTWDRDYLLALYEAPTRNNANLEESEMGAEMSKMMAAKTKDSRP